jgi:hypothetical protein
VLVSAGVSKPRPPHLKFCIAVLVAALAHAAAAAGLDTAKLDEARSLVAEAAALEAAQARSRVTGAYADGIREDLRKDLEKLLKEPDLRAAVQGALTAMDCHDAASLAAIRDRLVAMERAHGRAS